ncbi:MAG: exodeoxyribonuclease III [Chthoniobacterales bacterium]|nr:exodeoxyribonuclease III [Chthoniobacterales bacterium]
MKLVSWNVNGLRSILGKGLLEFWASEKPDVLCLQEIKARPEQVAGTAWPRGFEAHWNSAEKPGYSGTATFAGMKPKSATLGIGAEEHDREGRVVTLEYDGFFLVNVYTPNSQRELTRLEYRTREWEPAFRKYLKSLEKMKPVIFCGDLNVAHTEHDLANPKSNRHNAGFTDEERTEFQALIDAGFVDTFRLFNEGNGHYTWWSYMNNARARNIGWRIDYFLVSASLVPRVKSARIMPHVPGSDHCPVVLELF